MQTAQLLAKAEQLARDSGRTLADVSRDLGLTSNALAVAKHAGRLSPGVAAAMADYLGEPVHQWVMQAVIEGERSAPLRRRLAPLARAAKSYLCASLKSALRTVSRGRPTHRPTSAQVNPLSRNRLASA